MCDPATLALMAVTIGTTLMSSGGDTVVNPPEAKAPAIAAPTSRKAGATVKLGRDNKKATKQATGDIGKFTEKRKAAVALGGLGRSGLTL